MDSSGSVQGAGNGGGIGRGLRAMGALVLAAMLAASTLWGARLLAKAPHAPLTFRVGVTLLGLLTALALRLARRCLGGGPGTGDDPRRAHGSAGFANARDMADLFVPKGEGLTPGSVLLGAVGSRLLAVPPLLARQHGVIVGGSGTGKSWGFFLPNVALSHGVSCVVTDPKSELWDRTSGFHPSVRYAPSDPDRSACFNWIPLCRDPRLAELCARAVVEAAGTERQEPPWPDLEAACLGALFSHTSTLPAPTPLAAYELFTGQEPAALMAMLLASPSPVARAEARILQQTHERMRGSVMPVVAAKLQFLRDPAVCRFTSADLDPPDFGRLRTSPQCLFWCVREQDIARLRPLSALFFTLLLEQLAAAPVSDGRGAVPVHLYLDEFANIGVIPQFDTTISLARGRGVSLWLGIQSLSQLEARYGRANAQTILTNCAIKIALSGLDVETADYFSRALGQATRQTPRRSWQKKRFALFAGGVSDTVQDHVRPLLTPDEVRRIGSGEALAIIGNRRPILLKKFVYDLAPQAATTMALGPALSVPIPAPSEPAPKKASEARKSDVKGLEVEEWEGPPPFPDELTSPTPAKRPGPHPANGPRSSKGRQSWKGQKPRRGQTTWGSNPAPESKWPPK